MTREIHYEVFVIHAGEQDWNLHQVFDERRLALNAAKYALLQATVSGAKVVKETHNLETGEYLPITVFENGSSRRVKRRRIA